MRETTPRQRALAALLTLGLLAGCSKATTLTGTPGTPATTPTPKPAAGTPTTAPSAAPSTPTPPSFAAGATAPAQPGQPANPWLAVDPTPDMPSYSHPAPAHRTQYKMDLAIDPVAMRLGGTQTVHFTNDESGDLASLVFHLFPNAPYFQVERDGTPRVRPGSLLIDDLQVGGQKVPAIKKADGEAIEVPLPQPLAPGQSVDIALTWHEAIPSVEDRYGVIGSEIMLGNFFPILAVHDQGGWHIDKYCADMGDSFYSEVADYDVALTIPNGYLMGATGHYDAPQVGPETTRYHFTAQDVRDFAAAASAHFKEYQADVDGIHIRYFRDEAGGPEHFVRDPVGPDETIKLIVGSMHFYNQKWGMYPYPDITVVDHIGMEYPQFIMAAPSPRVVPHELAHQWWYGVVGNDELRQIWDEGITEFSAIYYLAAAGQPQVHYSTAHSEAMNKSLYTYYAHSIQPNPLSYASTIYGRGWMLWESLRESMGTAAFEQMLRSFYQAHKFGVATWGDWRQAVQQAGGDKAIAIFDSYVTKDAIPADVPKGIAP